MTFHTEEHQSAAIADKKDITNINARKLVATGNTGRLTPYHLPALGIVIQEETRGIGVNGMRNALRYTMSN